VRRPTYTILIAALMLSAPTYADESKAVDLSVDSRRCTWLDETELARLSRLELESAMGDLPGLALDYSCSGNDVTIGIANAKTGIRVERRITGACCADVEPERTIALLAVGLLTAARPLLVIAKEDATEATLVLPAMSADGSVPPAQTTAPTVAPVVEPAQTAPANQPLPEPRVAPAIVAPIAPANSAWRPTTSTAPTPDAIESVVDPEHQLGMSARTRFLNLDRPISSFGVGASYRAWPWRTIALGARFGANFGSTSRPGGDVDVRVLSLGGLAAWRFVQWSAVSLRAELEGGATLVQIEGVSETPSYSADSLSGVTGHVGFSIVPALRNGHAELALPIELGGVFRAPRGIVSDAEAVQVDGFFLGGGVAFSYGWGEHRGTNNLGVLR
jgi:hypothetical protein